MTQPLRDQWWWCDPVHSREVQSLSRRATLRFDLQITSVAFCKAIISSRIIRCWSSRSSALSAYDPQLLDRSAAAFLRTVVTPWPLRSKSGAGGSSSCGSRCCRCPVLFLQKGYHWLGNRRGEPSECSSNTFNSPLQRCIPGPQHLAGGPVLLC